MLRVTMLIEDHDSDPVERGSVEMAKSPSDRGVAVVFGRGDGGLESPDGMEDYLEGLRTEGRPFEVLKSPADESSRLQCELEWTDRRLVRLTNRSRVRRLEYRVWGCSQRRAVPPMKEIMLASRVVVDLLNATWLIVGPDDDENWEAPLRPSVASHTTEDLDYQVRSEMRDLLMCECRAARSAAGVYPPARPPIKNCADPRHDERERSLETLVAFGYPFLRWPPTERTPVHEPLRVVLGRLPSISTEGALGRRLDALVSEAKDRAGFLDDRELLVQFLVQYRVFAHPEIQDLLARFER